MKRSILFFSLFIVCLCSRAQSVIPQVNENVELMSILSRVYCHVWPVFLNTIWIWRADT